MARITRLAQAEVLLQEIVLQRVFAVEDDGGLRQQLVG